MVEKEYKEKTDEFKQTAQLELQREMMQERLDELENLRSIYEEKLSNVREEVRTEIKSGKSTWWVDISYINNYFWTREKNN